MRTRWILAAAALGLGLLAGFVLPSDWVFVAGPAQRHEAHGDTKYACPMFCVVMDEKPDDGRCPVCGMALTEVSGRSTLTPQERRMIGLQVEAVRRRPLERSLRVVGEVDYDETRLARITTRVPGWLEKVWADTTWMQVKRGDRLAAFYSPELVQAQQELLVELEMGGAGAAERKLRLLGVADEEIAELKEARTVRDALVLRAPRDGVVVERRAVEGASVAKGALLYTVADLSRVWLQVEVLEPDVPWVREGMEVRLEVRGLPRDLQGRVAFIDPVLDRRTRTARARIELDNPSGQLRIGQRVDAFVVARLGADGRPVPREEEAPELLAVPRSAVLSTGEREVAYVLYEESMGKRDYDLNAADLPDTVFYEMVELKLGPAASHGGAEYYAVVSGLEEGWVVAAKGNLLLDSQAQLSGKPSLLFPEGSRGAEGDPHAGH